MKFNYSTVIVAQPGSGDMLCLRRPEIPIKIQGPNESMQFVGLVDTGSDYTIFPRSIAKFLGVELHESEGPTAQVFGGQAVELLTAEVELILALDSEKVSWLTVVSFFDYGSVEDESVILGHAGFLEFFTATFDGFEATLTLEPNPDLASL